MPQNWVFSVKLKVAGFQHSQKRVQGSLEHMLLTQKSAFAPYSRGLSWWAANRAMQRGWQNIKQALKYLLNTKIHLSRKNLTPFPPRTSYRSPRAKNNLDKHLGWLSPHHICQRGIYSHLIEFRRRTLPSAQVRQGPDSISCHCQPGGLRKEPRETITMHYPWCRT